MNAMEESDNGIHLQELPNVDQDAQAKEQSDKELKGTLIPFSRKSTEGREILIDNYLVAGH